MILAICLISVLSDQSDEGFENLENLIFALVFIILFLVLAWGLLALFVLVSEGSRLGHRVETE